MVYTIYVRNQWIAAGRKFRQIDLRLLGKVIIFANHLFQHLCTDQVDRCVFCVSVHDARECFNLRQNIFRYVPFISQRPVMKQTNNYTRPKKYSFVSAGPGGYKNAYPDGRILYFDIRVLIYPTEGRRQGTRNNYSYSNKKSILQTRFKIKTSFSLLNLRN